MAIEAIPEELKQKILAGRKVVDAYRLSHTQIHKDFINEKLRNLHVSIEKELINNLRDLGFDSIDDFFDKNNLLNKLTFTECYRWEGECDGCPNRKRGCSEKCFQELCEYDNLHRQKTISLDKINPYVAANFYIEKYGEPDRDGNIIPNCKFKLIEVKKPSIDWRWKWYDKFNVKT